MRCFGPIEFFVSSFQLLFQAGNLFLPSLQFLLVLLDNLVHLFPLLLPVGTVLLPVRLLLIQLFKSLSGQFKLLFLLVQPHLSLQPELLLLLAILLCLQDRLLQRSELCLVLLPSLIGSLLLIFDFELQFLIVILHLLHLFLLLHL
jgi:hypothetical protein